LAVSWIPACAGMTWKKRGDRQTGAVHAVEDIYQRTGIHVDRVEIKQIDFKRETSLSDVRQSKERAFGRQKEVASAKLD